MGSSLALATVAVFSTSFGCDSSQSESFCSTSRSHAGAAPRRHPAPQQPAVIHDPWRLGPGGHRQLLPAATVISLVALAVPAALRRRRRLAARPSSLRRHAAEVGAAAADSGAEQGNRWRDEPDAALAEALGRADAEWAVLQAQADVEAEAGRQHSERLAGCAAEILSSSAMDRLRPYVVPAEFIDIPPLRGGGEALAALLGDEGEHLVLNFLSGSRSISMAGRAFWQAELYLRSLQETPGEAPVEEAARSAGRQLEAEESSFRDALRGSVLLARQNFISAARFGYFLRRSRQRWQLEQELVCVSQAEDEDEDGEDFLSALRRQAREVRGGVSSVFGQQRDPPPAPEGLDAYLGKLPAEQAVELVRVATKEAALAVEVRATSLFGSERSLMEQLETGNIKDMAQLRLSSEGRLRLSLEAAAWGAALYEAEEAAGRSYNLEYTAFGSRMPPPSF